MKTLIALGVIVGLLGVFAAPAGATTPAARKIAVLQKQVKVLQKQVVFLRNELGANYSADACGWALTADTFQASWTETDNRSGSMFGPQTTVSDKGACASLEPAVPRNQTAPPKTTIFQPLINWINP